MHLDIVFKAFVGMLVAVVIMGSGLGVMTAFSQSVEVDNYMESVSKVIVESNYNTKVIAACVQEAKENGYVLEVQVQRATKVGVKQYARIRLSYYFEIPLFGLKQEKVQVKII